MTRNKRKCAILGFILRRKVNPGSVRQSEYNRISRSVAIELRDIALIRVTTMSQTMRVTTSHARANLH